MKKVSLLIFLVIVMFSSYGNEKEHRFYSIPGKITMTTGGSSKTVEFRLNKGSGHDVAGLSGTVTIDWGDGSVVETVEFFEDGIDLSYEYSDTISKTVTITSTHLTGFVKYGNRPVTSLNVSEAPGLVLLSLLRTYEEVDYVNRRIKFIDVSHQLSKLDLSKNIALEFLTIGLCQLSELDVTKNIALTHLDASYNQLAELDLSKNMVLTHLDARNNQLAKLDISNNMVLTNLIADNNQLTELKISNNKVLKVLYFNNNQLTKLDVTQNTVLEELYVKNNRLDAATLNALFKTLHNIDVIPNWSTFFDDNSVGFKRIINITGNPGSTNCDLKIANEKGWGVVRNRP